MALPDADNAAVGSHSLIYTDNPSGLSVFLCGKEVIGWQGRAWHLYLAREPVFRGERIKLIIDRAKPNVNFVLYQKIRKR